MSFVRNFHVAFAPRLTLHTARIVMAAVLLAGVGLTALTVTPVRAAGPTVVWDESRFVTLSSNNITDIAMANDFLLRGARSLSGFTAWLSDNVADDDGVLDSFSGTLGWAIYSNNAGQPGTLLASGQDAAPTLTDTGVQDASGCDIVRVDVGFPSAVVAACREVLAGAARGELGLPLGWFHCVVAVCEPGRFHPNVLFGVMAPDGGCDRQCLRDPRDERLGSICLRDPQQQ